MRSLRGGVKVIIIDIDGTLIYHPLDWSALRRRIREVTGIDPPKKPLAYFIDELKHEDPVKAYLVEELVRTAERESIAGLTPNEFLIDIMKRLKERGVRIALVTLRGRESAEGIIRKLSLNGIVDLLVTRDEALFRRDQLIHCLQAFGVEADEAIFIGDTDGDGEAANSAGISSIILPVSSNGRGVRSDVVMILEGILENISS